MKDIDVTAIASRGGHMLSDEVISALPRLAELARLILFPISANEVGGELQDSSERNDWKMIRSARNKAAAVPGHFERRDFDAFGLTLQGEDLFRNVIADMYEAAGQDRDASHPAADKLWTAFKAAQEVDLPWAKSGPRPKGNLAYAIVACACYFLHELDEKRRWWGEPDVDPGDHPDPRLGQFPIPSIPVGVIASLLADVLGFPEIQNATLKDQLKKYDTKLKREKRDPLLSDFRGAAVVMEVSPHGNS